MSGALQADLDKLEGRPYGFYKDLRGRSYDLAPGTLRFEHVQGDPFAGPSRIAFRVPPEAAQLPAAARATRDARRASADFLHRAVARALGGVERGRGSGRSGVLQIAPPGPQVLERTAVRVCEAGSVSLLLAVGLPASGRRILGREAVALLADRLSGALVGVLHWLDDDALERHVRALEDQVALRAGLAGAGLVAFVAADSALPRRSGADERPLAGALPFQPPASLARELDTPHSGRVRGLGIPEGVTLIVGGGYHGKSTLLAALALGVYDHAPGDGRERVVTRADAVMVRAEDGRSVRGVDLRAFIAQLPQGRRTDRFDSDDASGSTSQAAAIVEALEVGAGALLIDEDTAASNFMMRDARMRRLIPAAQEPITPYLDRVRWLWEERRVSSVLVVGGAGEYFDVADTVIQMESFRPRDVTELAREVAIALPIAPRLEPNPAGPLVRFAPRVPDPQSLDARRGRRARVRGVRTHTIEFGSEEIDVSALAQLVDPAQCRLIGDALLELARGACDGRRSLPELLDALDSRAASVGPAGLAEAGFGDRAAVRRFEIAAALNRLRCLRLVDPPA